MTVAPAISPAAVSCGSSPPGTAAFCYGILPGHRGHRFAVRALILVVDYAFASLDVVRAELLIEVDNTASQRVAAAAGFQREGTLRAVFEYLGGRHDAVRWSRLPTDPPPRSGRGAVTVGR